MQISLGLAFVAGLLSFISPCVLALVPVYFAYLAETAGAVGAAASGGGQRTLTVAARQPVLGQVGIFVASFGVVFVLLGTSAGLLGASLFSLVPFARQAAGMLVIALGLLMTGLFGPVLDRIRAPFLPTRLPEARSGRSVLLGGLFAVGWSPCIGPALGTILAMGASTQQVGVAALLLAFYAAGLGLPFLVVAAALPQLDPAMRQLRRWHLPIRVVAGMFVTVMGILIYLNAFARMAGLFRLLV